MTVVMQRIVYIKAGIEQQMCDNMQEKMRTITLINDGDLEDYENAPILIYSTFEKTRLNDLAAWFPKYAKRIAKVQTRLWDLLQVIRNNVYHPRFLGSFSIKNVLPALIPDMSYENMEVADGTEAGLAYERMIGGELDPDEREKIRTALLDYCKQDSLAMVRLLDHLNEAVK